MHELSLAGAIVDSVAKHARGRPVTVINLSVGGLRQVVPDSLQFYFGFVAEGTVCEGASLDIEVIAAELGCSSCGERWTLEDFVVMCPACGGVAVAAVAGNEFRIESIMIEEESIAPSDQGA